MQKKKRNDYDGGKYFFVRKEEKENYNFTTSKKTFGVSKKTPIKPAMKIGAIQYHLAS
jgi:hypothetical protein